MGSPFCRQAGFGANHPLSIPRVGTVLRLCELFGWLDDDNYRVAAAADVEQLAKYHDRSYVEALRAADARRIVSREVRERYAIGSLENPLFHGVFERAATQVGGSILAARLALQGAVCFHPAGGTHHGRRDRASGFCFFNDPVFAIITLRESGLRRVLYVDLDAHHGDGVQLAFEKDPGVMTVSIHQAGRWPYSGDVTDVGGGQARNLPVPAGFNDSELDFLMSEIVLPEAQRFMPEAVVITCGTDALSGDPLSQMELSNAALWRAVDQLLDPGRPSVVLGGGGYNPWTLARCWTGLWARLSGQEMPETLPKQAVEILAGLECDLIDEDEVRAQWLTTLRDAPNAGPVRAQVRDLINVRQTVPGCAATAANRRTNELA